MESLPSLYRYRKARFAIVGRSAPVSSLSWVALRRRLQRVVTGAHSSRSSILDGSFQKGTKEVGNRIVDCMYKRTNSRPKNGSCAVDVALKFSGGSAIAMFTLLCTESGPWSTSSHANDAQTRERMVKALPSILPPANVPARSGLRDTSFHHFKVNLTIQTSQKRKPG